MQTDTAVCLRYPLFFTFSLPRNASRICTICLRFGGGSFSTWPRDPRQVGNGMSRLSKSLAKARRDRMIRSTEPRLWRGRPLPEAVVLFKINPDSAFSSLSLVRINQIKADEFFCQVIDIARASFLSDADCRNINQHLVLYHLVNDSVTLSGCPQACITREFA